MAGTDDALPLGEIAPGERQEWQPRSPSPDCIICNPLGHVGCGCSHRRCLIHADTPDPIPDRPALAQAYSDFHKAEAEESKYGGLFYEAGERRAEAAGRIRELGGKL